MIVNVWLFYNAKKCYNNWSQLRSLTLVAKHSISSVTYSLTKCRPTYQEFELVISRMHLMISRIQIQDIANWILVHVMKFGLDYRLSKTASHTTTATDVTVATYWSQVRLLRRVISVLLWLNDTYPHMPDIFSRNYDHRPTFVCRQYRSIFVELFLVGSGIFVYFCRKDVLAVQGHPLNFCHVYRAYVLLINFRPISTFLQHVSIVCNMHSMQSAVVY